VPSHLPVHRGRRRNAPVFAGKFQGLALLVRRRQNGMYSINRGPNNANNPGVNFPWVSAWEKNNGTRQHLPPPAETTR
jgi:hypothetical protein